jgi:hypothetical protein
MIKLGLDVHGVIDEDPEFFSDLSDVMFKQGHSVFIITGQEKTSDLVEKINIYKIWYTAILSITTYQKKLGTPISYLDDRKSQPIMSSFVWNPSKAELCASAGIHIMIDDSIIYEPFFRDIKTQYIVYTPEVKEFLKTLFYFGGYDLTK